MNVKEKTEKMIKFAFDHLDEDEPGTSNDVYERAMAAVDFDYEKDTPEFVEEILTSIEDNIKDLRNHAKSMKDTLRSYGVPEKIIELCVIPDDILTEEQKEHMDEMQEEWEVLFSVHNFLHGFQAAILNHSDYKFKPAALLIARNPLMPEPTFRGRPVSEVIKEQQAQG